ncbi:response regulator [Cohnella sp. WQ 127256]|uniref:response regulator transcription factor n=1 Tax=Cohnella sp. WQ 127256 TaxID=2938790 RepID=UPI0021197BC9|nr:response regulator [Cohnella sp. WQ 127256]
MPTMMIVDDEETIRQGLRLAVERLAPRWEIVGLLEDGVEALNKVNSVQPDLMIIDISMPGMDGLELCHNLMERHPQIHKIILTGHNSFSYAQSAMRYGVNDYLLKPLQRKELVQSLDKLERDILLREESVREEMLRSDLLLQRAVTDLLSGENKDTVLLKTELRKIGWRDLLGDHAVILMMGGEGKGEGSLLRHMNALRNAVLEGNLNIEQTCGVKISANQGLILMQGNANLDQAQMKQWLCDQIPVWNRNEGGDSLVLGCSESFRELERMPEAYRQTMFSLFVQDGGTERKGVFLEQFNVGDREERLIKAIEINDYTSVVAILKRWAEECAPSNNGHPAFNPLHFFHFFSLVLGPVLAKIHTSLSASLQEEIPWLLSRIYPPYSLASFAGTIDQFALRLKQHSSGQKPETRRVIEVVKQYINDHYGDPDLRLEVLAGLVYMNTNYLSELFKQVTGNNFIDYLTDKRMAAAKLLLKETNLKTYEIALKIGYTNPKYFSTLFGRLCGSTPTEYRDKSNK